MILGSKARYAVMAMVDLAKNDSDKPMTLADISSRQEISLAYLEQIFPKLKKAELVFSIRGPGGGYMLSRAPADINVLSIIHAVDESLQMTRCEKEHSGGCMSTKAQCVTHSLWAGLGNHIENYLEAISLSDICDRKMPKMIDLLAA